jgi:hypothetical protein
MSINLNKVVIDKAKLDVIIAALKKLNLKKLNIGYYGNSVVEAQQILLRLKEIPVLAVLEFMTELEQEDVETLRASAQGFPHLRISIHGKRVELDEEIERKTRKTSSNMDALHLQLGIYAATRNAAEQAFLLNEFTREYPEDCVAQAQETIRDGMAAVALEPILNDITEFPYVITDMVQQYLGKSQTAFQVWQRHRTTPLVAMSSSSAASSASSSSSFSSSCSAPSGSSSSSSSSSCAVAMPAPPRTFTVMWPQVVEFLDPALAPDTDVEMKVASSKGKGKRKLDLGEDAEGRDAAEKTKQQKPQVP